MGLAATAALRYHGLAPNLNATCMAFCRFQYWIAVVHPSGQINGSPAFCHVRWRDQERRGWLLGLTISRPILSGSFSLIERWRQTSSDQRHRLCHEAGSCVEYLRFICIGLVNVFILGLEFGCRYPLFDCAQPKTLWFFSAPRFHALSRHREILHLLSRFRQVLESYFYYCLRLNVFVSQLFDVLLKPSALLFYRRAFGVQTVLGKRPNLTAATILPQV